MVARGRDIRKLQAQVFERRGAQTYLVSFWKDRKGQAISKTYVDIIWSSYRGYPAKRALSAMRKHGG